MRIIKFAEFRMNVSYESKDEFMQKYYFPELEDNEPNPAHKGKVIMIATDEIGIPYYWEVSKLINKYTGGKLNSKKIKSNIMLEKIGEALARRELFLSEEEEIEGFANHFKKAIVETGYQA